MTKLAYIAAFLALVALCFTRYPTIHGDGERGSYANHHPFNVTAYPYPNGRLSAGLHQALMATGLTFPHFAYEYQVVSTYAEDKPRDDAWRFMLILATLGVVAWLLFDTTITPAIMGVFAFSTISLNLMGHFDSYAIPAFLGLATVWSMLAIRPAWACYALSLLCIWAHPIYAPLPILYYLGRCHWMHRLTKHIPLGIVGLILALLAAILQKGQIYAGEPIAASMQQLALRVSLAVALFGPSLYILCRNPLNGLEWLLIGFYAPQLVLLPTDWVFADFLIFTMVLAVILPCLVTRPPTGRTIGLSLAYTAILAVLFCGHTSPRLFYHLAKIDNSKGYREVGPCVTTAVRYPKSTERLRGESLAILERYSLFGNNESNRLNAQLYYTAWCLEYDYIKEARAMYAVMCQKYDAAKITTLLKTSGVCFTDRYSNNCYKIAGVVL